MKNVKATVCQLKPRLGDKSHNLNIITESVVSADKHEANLIVFPELFLTGYSVGPQIHDMAESRDGVSLQEIGRLCIKYGIHVVIGFPEAGLDGNFYISSALIDDKGNIVEVYRKTHLFEDEKQYFTPGDTLKVADTALGKIGLLICFEIEFPEMARALKLQGAELLIVINANMEPYAEYHYIYAKSRAMENEIPLIICNRVGKEDNLVFCGDSMVIDQRGKELIHLKNKEMIDTVTIPIYGPSESDLNYIRNRRCELYSSLV